MASRDLQRILNFIKKAKLGRPRVSRKGVSICTVPRRRSSVVAQVVRELLHQTREEEPPRADRYFRNSYKKTPCIKFAEVRKFVFFCIWIIWDSNYLRKNFKTDVESWAFEQNEFFFVLRNYFIFHSFSFWGIFLIQTRPFDQKLIVWRLEIRKYQIKT